MSNQRFQGPLVPNTVFPDPVAIFSWQAAPLKEVAVSCLVVLDSSVLLLPYEVMPATLGEINDKLRALVDDDRLRIPGHVAREFAQSRPMKLLELLQQINNKKSKLPKIEGGKHPLLENIPAYQEVVEIEREIANLIVRYQNALSAVTSSIRSWEWSDPLSLIYGDLFTSANIIELTMDEASIGEELEFRNKFNIPPGYKDGGKSTNTAGDLVIWLTILQVGRETQRDLLLVTADHKSDWWHRGGGESIYPRFELVDEYRRASAGHTFSMVSLSELLDLVGASSEAVEDVRQEEEDSEEFLSFSAVLTDWPQIRESVKEVNRRIEALLQHVEPVSVVKRQINLATPYEFHFNRMVQDEVRSTIRGVLEQWYGRPVYLDISGPDGLFSTDVPF